jgi:uncharacterized protein (TIGR02588 family)
MTESRNAETVELEGTSLLEWFAAALGGAILAGMIGYMVFFGLTNPGTPPTIVLTAGPIAQAGSSYRVEFTARNDGYMTAAGFEIRGVLRQGGAIVEESHAVIDYVPGQSERKGGLFFTRDPRQGALELYSGGYSDP